MEPKYGTLFWNLFEKPSVSNPIEVSTDGAVNAARPGLLFGTKIDGIGGGSHYRSHNHFRTVV